MIVAPSRGQPVMLRYSASKATGRRPRLHRETGRIEILGRGPGPMNMGVRLDLDGRLVVVPRNNVFPATEPNESGERQATLWA